MSGKFELKRSDNGQFHYNLKAGNSQIILSSGMFATRAEAEAAIALARQHAGDDGCFQRKTSTSGEPYFSLVAPGGKNLGRSEMYSSPQAMENGIASVKKNGPDATVADLTA